MRIPVGTSMIEVVEGEIADQTLQAIVNAGNGSMLGNKGLDLAIARAGGPKLQEETRRIGACDFGEARITGGGNLKAKYVIHTAGPIYRGGRHGEDELLAKAYRSSLELAVKHGIRRIAFPSISTGANGYPIDEAAEIAVRTALQFLPSNPDLLLVRFVVKGREALRSYEFALKSQSSRMPRPSLGIA